jgi:hypothetical protein
MIYWFLFVVITSIGEAYIFHLNKFKVVYKHVILTLIRAIVCTPLALRSSEPFLFILFAMFTFPFLHDGIYYTVRHLLNDKIYPKMFIDKSYTTNAIISLSFFWRLILFIFGLGLTPVVL